MAYKIISRSKAYRPEDLLTIGRAFDEAWALLAHNFQGYEGQIDSARSKLADAMLYAASQGLTEISALKARALEDFVNERERKGTLPKVLIR